AGHPIAEFAEQVVPPAIALPATIDSAYVVSHAAAKTGKGNGVVEDDGGCRDAVGASPAIGGSIRRKGARAESACDNAGKTEAPLHRDGAPAVGRRAVTELTGIVEPPAIRGTGCGERARLKASRPETGKVKTAGYRRWRTSSALVTPGPQLPSGVVAPTISHAVKRQPARVITSAADEGIGARQCPDGR